LAETRVSFGGVGRTHRLRRQGAGIEDLNVLAFRIEPPLRQVSRGQASREYGMQDRQGDHILLGFQQGFQHAIYVFASGQAARHLGNHQGDALDLRMALAITGERLGHLLGRGDARVGEDISVNRVGIVEIEDA